MYRLRSGEITERRRGLRYDPGAANAHLIQCGDEGVWCDSVITEAFDTVSKRGGNAMLLTTFKVYDDQGKQPNINHYFLAQFPGMLKKLCAALDLNYESGNIEAETLKGKSVKVLIKIREDESGQFGDKNVIAAFQAKAVAKPSGPDTGDPHVFDPNDPALKDGIPF
jgi:hypothetical protein